MPIPAGTLQARARERDALRPDGPCGGRRQGRPRPAAARHRVGGDARAGGRPGRDEPRVRCRLRFSARARRDGRDAAARGRRQGEHRADDRRRGPPGHGDRVQVDGGRGRRRTGTRLHVQGELTLVGVTHPIAFDVGVGPDGELTAQGRRQAERLGHEAVLGAVRGPEGRGRGRGRGRRLRRAIAGRIRRGSRPPRTLPRSSTPASRASSGRSSSASTCCSGWPRSGSRGALRSSWRSSPAFFIFVLVRTRGIAPRRISRGRRSARRARPRRRAARAPVPCAYSAISSIVFTWVGSLRSAPTQAPFDHCERSRARRPAPCPASSCAFARILSQALTTAAAVPADGVVL